MVYAPHKAKTCSHAERARALGCEPAALTLTLTLALALTLTLTLTRCEPAALAVWSGAADDAGLRRLLRSAAAGGKAGEAELKECVQLTLTLTLTLIITLTRRG